MKNKLIYIAIILTTAGMIFGVVSGHIPIAHDHTDSICWGYAQGRAFGKTAGDAECDPARTYADHIDESKFPFVSGSDLTNIKLGDIVVFGPPPRAGANGHAAFVVGIPDPFVVDNITVDQVPNQGGPEQKGKLISEVRLLQGQGAPVGYHLGTGSATVTLTFKNSFGSGTINVGKDKFGNYLQRPSGWSGSFFSGTTVDINAIDGQQNASGITQRFQYWLLEPNTNLGSQNPRTITISSSGTYTAKFFYEYNVTFQNSLPYASGGTIKVSGVSQNAPYIAHVLEPTTSITGEALNQQIDRVYYTFSSWSPGGSTSASTTFPITSNVTYTANFTAKPLQAENCYAGGVVGDPVQITWTRHPNTNVTYKIYRRVKPLGGSTGPETLIASLSNATTSYTDIEYTVTSTYTNDLLSYDVRSDLNSVYSDPNFVQVFGTGDIHDNNSLSAPGTGSSSDEYSASSFPNPFNPSTTISYQLVEEANVTLEIYDMMGRKISSLVQEQKQAGYHTAKWEGKDNTGRQVATGAYLYRFSAIPTSGKQPFTKSGKLLLTK